MMVIFVSQCEKNALKKTRRVLDTFANRIGDNIWQTIITQEGLGAVKKLLRKTASKSTAISCHWIRTRARSEFIWVVGNREKFNSEGLVAVNYSETKKFIGEYENMNKEILANTQGQRLDKHMFAVAFLAKEIIKKLLPDEETLANEVFIAGVWHDMGKIDINFQDWLQKKLKKNDTNSDDGVHIDMKSGSFSWEKYPRHNEFSLLLYYMFMKERDERCEHAILWHHAKPIRKDEIKFLTHIFDKLTGFKDKYSEVINATKSILGSIKKMYSDYTNKEISLSLNLPKFDDIEDKIDRVSLSKYKQYTYRNELKKYAKDIRNNAKNTLARSALISADRLISKLSSEALEKHIEDKSLENLVESILNHKSDLGIEIRECLVGFEKKYPKSERNIVQEKASENLADEEVLIGVLNGPAGCGKTKIALEWALKTDAKKIYWVCPRVQICEGLFKDLTNNQYLPNTSIEIVTGDIKLSHKDGRIVETNDDELFSSNFILTTLDQIINSITTHTSITTLVDFMQAHVIFDEYHEYITMPAFNLLFAEILEAKKLQQNDDTLPNTLLVSATPNPLFISEFLGLSSNDIIGIKSFNNSDYKISFVEYDEKQEDINNPLYQKQDKDCFVISNTAITAQKSFIDNQADENSILLHSKYTKKDKIELFDKTFESFKENGNHNYDILRSGPIVQASLNISCNAMISEMSHAENFLQRLGRLDRFGKNDKVNHYTIAITSYVKEGKQLGGSATFLAKLFSLQSTKAWYEFLENNLNEKTLKITDIYKYYDDFYKDKTVINKITEDLLTSLKKSVEVIDAKVIDPLSFPSKKKEATAIKIKKNSLRGDSRFVQMARCHINSRENIEFTNDYMYDDEINLDAMTYDTKSIQGYGDSNKNLLSFMAKKHHNIKETRTKVYKDAQLLNEARDPNTPIYLSYTVEDLKKVESKPHSDAIYYVIGKKQPIGAISLQQLKTKGNDDEN